MKSENIEEFITEEETITDKNGNVLGFFESVVYGDKNDVSSMSYYDGKYKPIDAMLQQFGVEQVMSWCLLNAFKYLWRCDKKHDTPIEDIKKAMYYLNKYIELYGSNKDRK